jgi:hypothetical protein
MSDQLIIPTSPTSCVIVAFKLFRFCVVYERRTYSALLFDVIALVKQSKAKHSVIIVPKLIPCRFRIVAIMVKRMFSDFVPSDCFHVPFSLP